jgi:DNA-binding transcriptional regulator YhcF (GntR family)
MNRTIQVAASFSEEEARLPASERAYRRLKQLILDNEIPAGSQMLELEAAARLGMSRTPVREAMVRLEQEGMVELRSRHGMRVLPISADALAEIYEILTALEGIAAEAAARKGASLTQLAGLQQAVDEMEARPMRAFIASLSSWPGTGASPPSWNRFPIRPIERDSRLCASGQSPSVPTATTRPSCRPYVIAILARRGKSTNSIAAGRPTCW